MLKQIIVTLDTSDPLQAQLLVEYLASNDRVRFGRCCMLLGYLAGTQDTTQINTSEETSDSPTPQIPAKIALTLEDLGVEPLLPAQAKPSALTVSEAESTEGTTVFDAAPTANTFNKPREEKKTAAKPKVGGGLFGLD
jgi:hypothetical protein